MIGRVATVLPHRSPPVHNNITTIYLHDIMKDKHNGTEQHTGVETIICTRITYS